jgi:hypothetical protein
MLILISNLKADINLVRTGRAAIVANDYATRDAQIDIIKAKLAIVPAVRAVLSSRRKRKINNR